MTSAADQTRLVDEGREGRAMCRGGANLVLALSAVAVAVAPALVTAIDNALDRRHGREQRERDRENAIEVARISSGEEDKCP